MSDYAPQYTGWTRQAAAADANRRLDEALERLAAWEREHPGAAPLPDGLHEVIQQLIDATFVASEALAIAKAPCERCGVGHETAEQAQRCSQRWANVRLQAVGIRDEES
jgi:hypothetical protein